MTVSKIRLNGTDHDIRAKYLIQSTSADAVSEEFVSKTTTEDATFATIQKIYGNTIKWNQLIQNGNFANGATGWTGGSTNVSMSVSNGIMTVTTGSGNTCIRQDINFISQHKYYISFIINAATSGYIVYVVSPTQWLGSLPDTSLNTDYRFHTVVTANSNKTQIYFGRYGNTSGTSYKLSNVWVVDLTDMYGSGNEPDIAEFEAEFNQPYYDYNPSGLLSVKAASIQSKDSNDNVIGNCDLNIPTLTGKLNGAGSSVVIFPNGMQSNGTTRDEMAATSAIKRIADDNSVLSTPQTYILDNALQLQYPVVAGGTEMVLPTTGTAPMKMDVIYGNAADAAATMSQNYISVDSMKEFLAALGTQMGGTWSMGYEDGKHTFTFTT